MEKRTGISLHGAVDISYIKSSELYDMPVQHYHEGYEIYFQVDGSRFFFLKDKQYLMTKGTIAVVLPYELHFGESTSQAYYERYTVNFKKEYLELVLGNEAEDIVSKLRTDVLTLTNDQALQMTALLKNLYAHKNKKSKLEEKIWGCGLVALLSIILDLNCEKESMSNLPEGVNRALNYMDTHYAETLTLEDIAKNSNLDVFYLSHLFKKCMGISVKRYLLAVRTEKAYRMLMDGKSVEQAAQKSGFANYEMMERAFKKIYSCTPISVKKLDAIRKTKNKEK